MNFVLSDIRARECVPVFVCVLAQHPLAYTLAPNTLMSIDGAITFSADTAVTLLRPCRNYTPEDLLQAHSKHTLSWFFFFASATPDIIKISHWGERKY